MAHIEQKAEAHGRKIGQLLKKRATKNIRRALWFSHKVHEAPTSTFLSGSTLEYPRIHRPNLRSAKLTSDGKTMIVPDEDETADLFHIFSIP